MNETSIILSLLALFVGWLLNEVSHRWRKASIYRRAISKALADLLEIRHQIKTMEHIFHILNHRLKLPQSNWASIYPFIENIWPDSNDIHKRYNDAVNLISSVNPILGFRLRSKDELTPLLKRSRQQLLSQDPSAATVWPQFESTLIDWVKPHLDEMILELAKAHGWRTWWKIREDLKRPEDQKKMDEICAKIVTSIQQPADEQFNKHEATDNVQG